MKLKAFASAVVLFFAAGSVSASGPVGIYGIVEKVVFEPNQQSPERIQVWGAFLYVDGDSTSSLNVSPAKRGYLYFRLPPLIAKETVEKEWADLRTVAGTGQAVAFGRWGYIGAFAGLQPDTGYILEMVSPNSAKQTDLRVHSESEAPQNPAAYQTNAGIVKLSEQGSHAAIVKILKETLQRK